MKLLSILRPAILWLLVGVISPLKIYAQDGAIHLPEKRFRTDQVMMNKRPLLKFEPIVIKDEKGIAMPDSRVLTMKDGRNVTVRQLTDDLNKLEKELNATGYSLRQKGTVDILKGIRYDEQKVAAQLRAVSAKGKYLPAAELNKRFNKTSITVGNRVVKPIGFYSSGELHALNANPIRVVVANGQLKPAQQPAVGVQPHEVYHPDMPAMSIITPEKSIKVNERKLWELGDAELISIKLTAGINGITEAWRTPKSISTQTAEEVLAAYEQSKTQFGFTAEANGDLHILGEAVSLLKARAYTHADADASDMTVSIYAAAGGKTLMNFTKSYNNQKSFSYADHQEWGSFDASARYCIPIWYILLCGEVGAHGEVGVDINTNGSRYSLTTSVEPYASLQGYFSVGVDAFVIGASLKEKLTIMDARLPMYYNALMLYTGPNFVLYHSLNASYQITAMKGVIGIDAWMGCCKCPRICIPFLGCLDDLCLRDFFPIWEHGGLVTSGMLYESGESLTNISW